MPQRFFGISQVASVLQGDCRMLWIGDSTAAHGNTPRMPGGILEAWPLTVKGVYVPPFTGTPEEGTIVYYGPLSNLGPSSTAPDGSTNLMALPMGAVRALSNLGDYAAISESRIVFNSGLVPYLGKWGIGTRVRIRRLHRRPTTDLEWPVMIMANYRSGVAGSDSYPSKDYRSTTPSGLSVHEWDINDSSSPAVTDYVLNYSTAGGGQNETGSSFITNGHLFYTPNIANGLMFASVSYGGWSTSSHSTGYTQAQADAVCQYLFPSPPNLIMIQLGTNYGTGEGSADSAGRAAYVNNLSPVIQRWQNACVNAGGQIPHVVLVNPWQAAAGQEAWLQERANALAVLSGLFPKTGFVDLGGLVNDVWGSYSTWQGVLTTDGIHQSMTGRREFARLLYAGIMAGQSGGYTPRVIGA